MKEIIKNKTKKFYYEEEKVYKCETCGKEWDASYQITKCHVCGKDICPNCDCKDISQFEGYLSFQDWWNGKSITLTKDSFDGYKMFQTRRVEGDDTVPVTKFSVHKECAGQKMKPAKYMAELLSIVAYFNDSIEHLNNNAFKEYKTKEEFLRDKYVKEIESYKKENDQCYGKIKEYEKELNSNAYKKFKSLTNKQKQMLELMEEK